LWQGSQLPFNAPVVLGNRHYSLTARPTGDQVHVDLTEIKPGLSASAR
jgi:hypothetical protein